MTERYCLTDLSEVVGPLAQHAVALGYLVEYSLVTPTPSPVHMLQIYRFDNPDEQVAYVHLAREADGCWRVTAVADSMERPLEHLSALREYLWLSMQDWRAHQRETRITVPYSLMTPTRIPDLVVYRGDPKVIKFQFTDAAGAPRDMSACVWTPTLRCEEYDFTVDASQAADGLLYLQLSEEATTGIATPSVYWDLYEDVVFHKTVFNGKLVFQEQA